MDILTENQKKSIEYVEYKEKADTWINRFFRQTIAEVIRTYSVDEAHRQIFGLVKEVKAEMENIELYRQHKDLLPIKNGLFFINEYLNLLHYHFTSSKPTPTKRYIVHELINLAFYQKLTRREQMIFEEKGQVLFRSDYFSFSYTDEDRVEVEAEYDLFFSKFCKEPIYHKKAHCIAAWLIKTLDIGDNFYYEEKEQKIKSQNKNQTAFSFIQLIQKGTFTYTTKGNSQLKDWAVFQNTTKPQHFPYDENRYHFILMAKTLADLKESYIFDITHPVSQQERINWEQLMETSISTTSIFNISDAEQKGNNKTTINSSLAKNKYKFDVEMKKIKQLILENKEDVINHLLSNFNLIWRGQEVKALS